MDMLINRYIFWADSFLSCIYFLFVPFLFMLRTSTLGWLRIRISAENYLSCMLAVISKVICSSWICCLSRCTISSKLEHTFHWYICFISDIWQLYSYFLLHVSVFIGNCQILLHEYSRSSWNYGFFFKVNYSPTNAQVIVLKTLLKFTLK
jgi:hypothetical protein